VEEMAGERLSYSETSKVAREISEENLKRVCGILNDYWSAIETLANALLQHKTLSESRAFEIMEQVILSG
jgi:ATP-dependent Zn protease